MVLPPTFYIFCKMHPNLHIFPHTRKSPHLHLKKENRIFFGILPLLLVTTKFWMTYGKLPFIPLFLLHQRSSKYRGHKKVSKVFLSPSRRNWKKGGRGRTKREYGGSAEMDDGVNGRWSKREMIRKERRIKDIDRVCLIWVVRGRRWGTYVI